MNIVNPHGDVFTTIPDVVNVTAAQVGACNDTDEFGVALTPSAPSYGWVGGKLRATNTATGLIQMGVRVYDPVTGRFLSTDPVYGGNDNSYTYPVDPIGGYDLSGKARIYYNYVGFWFAKTLVSVSIFLSRKEVRRLKHWMDSYIGYGATAGTVASGFFGSWLLAAGVPVAGWVLLAIAAAVAVQAAVFTAVVNWAVNHRKGMEIFLTTSNGTYAPTLWYWAT